MFRDKRSFFERITGSISVSDDEREDLEEEVEKKSYTPVVREKAWLEEEEEEEGELSVDVYQTNSEIVIQSMVAGVKPENLNISITREMVTIQGKRERPSEVGADNYFQKELYWGSFSRKILLPAEVESSESEAFEKNGLLTIRMPKIDKEKMQKVKVRSL